MPIDFNGAGLLGPYEMIFQVGDFGLSPNPKYIDLYDEMERSKRRAEITGIMVPPIIGAQTITEYGNIDVTLFGEPLHIHHVLSLRAGEIYHLRVRRIWFSGCTDVGNIRIFGIAV